MNNVVKKSDTVQTLTVLSRDVKTIQTTLSGTIHTTKSRVDEIRRSNFGIRSIYNWFKNNGADDFDATFGISDTDEAFETSSTEIHEETVEEDKQSTELDKDHMREISDGFRQHQMSIGRQSIESKLFSTSEIINNIDSQTSNVVSLLRETTSITNNISNKLSILLSKYNTESRRLPRERGLNVIDDGGLLTLRSVMNFVIYAWNQTTINLGEIIKEKTIIGYIDKYANDVIVNTQTSLLKKLFSSDKMQTIFGNPFRIARNGDYSSVVTNGYTTDPAAFDSRTRKTIVDIIPGYLRLITEGLTGKRFNVSNYGTLTTRTPENRFQHQITSTFTTYMINDQYIDKIFEQSKTKNAKVSNADVRMMQQVLISQYIYYSYANGKVIVDAKDLESGGYASIHNRVIKLFAKSSEKDTKYWQTIIMVIENELRSNRTYRQNFARSVTSGFKQLDDSTKQVISEMDDPSVTMHFTQQMFDEYAVEYINSENNLAVYEGLTPEEIIRKGYLREEQIPKKYLKNKKKPIVFNDLYLSELEDSFESSTIVGYKESAIDTVDCYDKIFELFNRGINVYSMYNRDRIDDAFDQPIININAFPIDILRWNGNQKSSTKHEDVDELPKEEKAPIQPTYSGIVGAIDREIQRLDSDVVSITGYTKDTINTRLDITRLQDDADDVISSKDSTEKEKSDAENIKMVIGLLKTLNKDGDVDKADIALIRDKLQYINDTDKRERLSKLVDDIANQTNNKPHAKSLLGKGLLFIFGIAKSAISKVIGLAKPFFMSFGSLYKKIFSSAFKDVTRGAKNIKEGFIGKKGDRNGLLQQGARFIKDTFFQKKQKDDDNIDDDQQKETPEENKEPAQIKPTKSKETKESKEETPKKKKRKTLSEKISSMTPKSDFGKGIVKAFTLDPEEELAKEKALDTVITPLDKYTKDIKEVIEKSTSDSLLNALSDAVDQFGESFIDFTQSLKDKELAKIEHEKKKRAKAKKEKEKKEKEHYKKGSISQNLGQITGGIMQILGGIFKSVKAVIKSMAGLTAIMNIGEKILQKSLKPLNKVFNRLYRMLKPISKLVTKILRQCVNTITLIVTSIVDVIKPIFEAISPLLETILDTLKPILEIVTDSVNNLLVPLFPIINTFILPSLQQIANLFQFICGILEIGIGFLMQGIGGALMVAGAISKVITSSPSIVNNGTTLFTNGTALVSAGKTDISTSIANSIAQAKETINKWTGKSTTERPESQKRTKQNISIHGSAFDATYGSGDDDLYMFDEDTRDAFAEIKDITSRITKIFSDDEDYDISNGAFSDLRNLTNNIIGIFTGDYNETMAEQLEHETQKQQAAQSNIDWNTMTEEEHQQIEALAYQEFLKNTNTTGMTDEQILQKFERVKSKYLDYATQLFKRDKMQQSNENGILSFLNNAVGENGSMNQFADSMIESYEQTQSGGLRPLIEQYNASRNTTSSSSGYSSGLNGQSRIAYEGSLQQGNVWDHFKSKSGVPQFMKIAFDAGLTGAQVATIASMGIWEDGGEKIFGDKSLTATTYDVNGQQAVGIMNWVDKSVNYGNTVPEQLQYIKRTYFDPSSTDSRAFASSNQYWSQDEAAYAAATGRPGFKLQKGARYGPVMEQDLIEGSEQYFRTALIPECIHTESGPRKYIGTAVGVYNWLIDQGYINKPTSTTTRGTGVLTGSSDAEKIFNYLTSLGMTDTAAAGILGCFHYESAMKSNNLENTFNNQFGMSDEEYTAAVDSRRETKDQFIHGRYATYISGQTPGEAVGYGLAQFTSSDLKREIYENSVERGKSISDPAAQIETLIGQLKRRDLYQKLNAASSPTEANKIFLWKYEAGTGYTSDAGVLSAYPWMRSPVDGYANSVEARHGMAEQYYRQFGGGEDEFDLYDDTMLVNPYEETISQSNIIPPLPQEYDPQPEPMNLPTIINQYATKWDIPEYIDALLTNEYDVESARIKDLTSKIFDELPEYLEYDDDYEYDEDDEYIRQLAANFL